MGRAAGSTRATEPGHSTKIFTMQQISNPTTCRDVREGLTEYLDNALPSSRRQGMESHIDTCAHCQAFIVQFEAMRHELAALPRESMPAEMKQNLLQAFRSRQSA